MNLKRRKANNLPISWSPEDEEALLNLLVNGNFTFEEVTKLFPERPEAGLKSKIRRLRIKHDLFGTSYRDNKESFTLEIAKKVKPKIVFDAYAGAGHQTFKWVSEADTVFAADKMKTKLSQFEKTANENGFKLLKRRIRDWVVFKKEKKRVFFYPGDVVDAAADIRTQKIEIDLIDLDTCGSTLPLLPTLLVLLKPTHLVITHGEYHSMRFQREDVLRRIFTHRDITLSPFPITVDKMGQELDRAVKTAALRAHNETIHSFWADLEQETWLGSTMHGMLRRHYRVRRPPATSDCINAISKNHLQKGKK